MAKAGLSVVASLLSPVAESTPLLLSGAEMRQRGSDMRRRSETVAQKYCAG